MENENNKKSSKLGFWITSGLIVVAGYLTYNTVYQNVNYRLSSEKARDTYNDRMAEFSDLSLDGDLSKYVFNETGLDVSENEYYEEFNKKLVNVKSLNELEKLAISYIRGYFEYNNIRLHASDVDLLIDGEEVFITYENDEVGLDADAEVVFKEMVKTIAEIRNGNSNLSEEELKNKLIAQILVSQTYETVTINSEQLTLRPQKLPNDSFTI